MAYGGNKKISALRWRFIHQDGITIVDLTVGHFSILLRGCKQPNLSSVFVVQTERSAKGSCHVFPTLRCKVSAYSPYHQEKEK